MDLYSQDAARRTVVREVARAVNQDTSEAGPILVRHKAPSFRVARDLVSLLTAPTDGLRSIPGIGRARLPCSIRLRHGEGVVVEVAVSR